MHKVPAGARHAARLCVLSASLAGCAGLTPQGGPVAPLQQSAPMRAAKSQGDLLYLGAGRVIQVYAYPAGTLEGKLSTTAGIDAMCSDDKGDVFITATQIKKPAMTGFVYEYAHGGDAPIAMLDLPSNDLPVECSSDPTTGNLAVTSYNAKTFAPQIQIYANASGTPKTYVSKALGASPQPAYDGNGNLFVTSGGNVGVMLPAGKETLRTIVLNETLGGVAHAQWDGKYFALQSFRVSKHQGERLLEHVFRVSISGTTGTVVGFSHFVNWLAKVSGQSWIQGDTMIATPGAYVAFWNYPSGGKAIKTLHPPHVSKAVTVSIGQ
jgi:hypothetical protein